MTGQAKEPGTVALVGGAEWEGAGREIDSELLYASGADEVLVLPTAAAFEHPERVVLRAQEWFSSMGASARALMVLDRSGAMDPGNAAAVSSARFVYLSGGSPLHLRSVLKGSLLWEALLGAWRAGAVLAGSSAGAMVLTDPMVDPRGGAFTVGLGLLEQMAVIPHYGHDSAEKVHRSIVLAGSDFPVVGIPERTALLRRPDGSWHKSGEGEPSVFVGGRLVGLDALPH